MKSIHGLKNILIYKSNNKIFLNQNKKLNNLKEIVLIFKSKKIIGNRNMKKGFHQVLAEEFLDIEEKLAEATNLLINKPKNINKKLLP